MTQSFDIKIIEGISAQTIRFFKKKRSVKEFLDLVSTCATHC